MDGLDKKINDFLNKRRKRSREEEIKEYLEEYEEACKEYYELDRYDEEGLKNLLKAVNEVEDDEEQIAHPTHYNQGKYEVWDVIGDWGLDFFLGNVIKYIARAGHKGDALVDLKKAQTYLDEYIERMEKRNEK